MFTSPILRSTISLSGQALKRSAPKHVQVSFNKSNAAHLGKLYLSRIPRIFQWGGLLGTMLFWPSLIAAPLIDATGGINARV